jgi:hypothetical protein
MPIPESQLKAWAAQGSAEGAAKTFESARGALLAADRSLVREKKVDVFLQGSYADGTNLGDKSPVDVAAVLTSAWSQDLAMGGASQADERRLRDSFQDFRLDVLGSLRAEYGLASVEDRPDCLFVEGAAGRLPLQVTVGIQHRLYLSFGATSEKQYQEGLSFWTPDARQVICFPKLHHANGLAKDGEAGAKGWFKPIVRIFKSARDHLAQREVLDPGMARSYFLECLAYNVPDRSLGWSLADSLAGALKWLGAAQLSGLRAQNGIDPLFGSGPRQWSDRHARLFIATLVRAWNAWPPAAQ